MEFRAKFVFERKRGGEEAFPEPLPPRGEGSTDPNAKAVHDPLSGKFQGLL